MNVDTDPDPEAVCLLEKRIYEFNVQQIGIADGKSFGLFLRDATGAVIGGV